MHDDVAADGRLQLPDAPMQGLEFLFEVVRRRDGRFEVEQIKFFDPLLNPSAPNHVQASVSHACKQIRLDGFFLEVAVTVKKSSEDVVHHILALRIVVQKHGGQPIHLTIMLLEQLLKFLLCHTIIIHTKNHLLNPKRQLFSIFKCKIKENRGKLVLQQQISGKSAHKDTEIGSNRQIFEPIFNVF